MAVSARPDGVTLGPTTGWGRMTIGLAAGFIVFGIAFFIAAATGQKGGDTLGDNLWLSIPGIAGAACAALSLLSALVAVVARKERSMLVFVALALTAASTIFLVGELL